MARNQADEPGVLALVDLALQHRVQAFEPLRRKSLGFRRGRRQRLRGGRGRRQDEGYEQGESAARIGIAADSIKQPPA